MIFSFFFIFFRFVPFQFPRCVSRCSTPLQCPRWMGRSPRASLSANARARALAEKRPCRGRSPRARRCRVEVLGLFFILFFQYYQYLFIVFSIFSSFFSFFQCVHHFFMHQTVSRFQICLLQWLLSHGFFRYFLHVFSISHFFSMCSSFFIDFSMIIPCF